MSLRLDGKIAIVTGGLSGIGAAIHEVRARHGRLDCIVDSAGIGSDVPFLETSLTTFDRILSVNLRGSFIVGQAAARVMRETGGGAIVNVASVSGITGNAGRSAYGAPKWGVVGLSRVMAIDLATCGIRVNVIAPGAVETPLVDRMQPLEDAKQWTERTPLRRYAKPEEIAGAAVFLCSADASYITGHVLVVDEDLPRPDLPRSRREGRGDGSARWPGGRRNPRKREPRLEPLKLLLEVLLLGAHGRLAAVSQDRKRKADTITTLRSRAFRTPCSETS